MVDILEGFDRMQSEVDTPNIPILMYHSISDHAQRRFKQFTVAPELFAQHVAFLHQQGYMPLSVTQFVTLSNKTDQKLPDRPVILTFDDGFADFFTAALPVLQQYHFPATLYVATAFVNRTSSWLQHEEETERPMVTWEQLAAISAAGIECGAHTHNHLQLDTLPSQVALKEIAYSKMILEKHLGQPVYSFAYPFGYYSSRIQRQLLATGYTSACAVRFALSSVTTDPFALKRLIVTNGMTVQELQTLMQDKQGSSLQIMYRRACTPVWQVVRRGSALLTRAHTEDYTYNE